MKKNFLFFLFIFYFCFNSFSFIKDFGKEEIVDYSKYGKFEGIGTENYKYVITNKKGLGDAQGEGIYPNTWSIYEDSGFKKAKEKGLLEGNRWNFVNIDDKSLAFYKWAISFEEDPGLRQFFVATALEKAGFLKQAIKAYYTIVVCFPRTIGQTYWHQPWYVGDVALNKIKFLCGKHPELNLSLEGASINIKNRFDNDISNDVFIVSPGKLVKGAVQKKENLDLMNLKKINVKSFGRISLVKYSNGFWEMFVDNKPRIIKGMVYSPSVIGQSPDKGTMEDWMHSDVNKNGIIDGPYETWVDKNRNNIQDKNEPVVGDFTLLKEMGVNTIRLYHHATNKNLLRDLYNNYGIMVVMGDFLGMYTVGSNAGWYEGTDYKNPKHLENMLNSVEAMINEYKNEPYILMWVLGNENNYGNVGIETKTAGSGCNAGNQPVEFYKFVEVVAKKIKELDPNHPVAIANGDLLYYDIFSKECPSVDIFGCNAYRGMDGFGESFWQSVKNNGDYPIMVTEYGCPAFYWGKSEKEAERYQKIYNKNSWEDIEQNSYLGNETGICLGGFVFEWTDEWWKAYFPYYHDSTGQWAGPFPDGWMYEEWLGITSQGNGKHSPFLRQLRETYFYYKDVWGKS
jgi:hypothetical protein